MNYKYLFESCLWHGKRVKIERLKMESDGDKKNTDGNDDDDDEDEDAVKLTW